MKYFGHLSHSCIKSRRSNVHKPIFFDILTENIYVSVYDRKKTGPTAYVALREAAQVNGDFGAT